MCYPLFFHCIYALVTLLIATCSIVLGFHQRWPICQPLWALWYSHFHKAACFMLVINSYLVPLPTYFQLGSLSRLAPPKSEISWVEELLLCQKHCGVPLIFVDKFILQFVDLCFPSAPCPIKAPLPGLYEVQGFGAVRWEKGRKGNWGLFGPCCAPSLNQQQETIWVTVFLSSIQKTELRGRLVGLLHKVMNVVHITALLFKDGRLVITAFLEAFPPL